MEQRQAQAGMWDMCMDILSTTIRSKGEQRQCRSSRNGSSSFTGQSAKMRVSVVIFGALSVMRRSGAWFRALSHWHIGQCRANSTNL